MILEYYGPYVNTGIEAIKALYSGYDPEYYWTQETLDNFGECMGVATEIDDELEDLLFLIEDPPERYEELAENLEELCQSCYAYYDYFSVVPVYKDAEDYAIATGVYKTPVSNQLENLLEEYPDLYLEEE